MVEVTLPWPPRALSPNSRAHWRKLASVKALYRRACWALTRDAVGVDWPRPASGPVTVALEFVPPDRRQRDLDNCVASLKAGLDGVADALQIDDHRFALACQMAAPNEIGGYVRVRVGQ